MTATTILRNFDYSNQQVRKSSSTASRFSIEASGVEPPAQRGDCCRGL